MPKPFAGCSYAVLMNSIERTKQNITKIIAESTVPEDPVHARNTLKWLLKLKPDADEALQISALGHDIERALEKHKVRRANFQDYDEFKAAHARNSAEILRDVMQECGVQERIIEDVYRLVCRHETGGDTRADLVKYADSISFFEVNLPLYFERNSCEETKRRCIWSYKRLSERMKPHVINISYGNRELECLMKQAIKEAEESQRR